MPTLTSSVPDVTDYLLAQCQASASLGAAVPPVEIIDGPQITSDALAEGQRLWVGWDALTGGATQAGDAGAATQAWALLDNARTRDEHGSVILTAEDWSGDTRMQTHRDAVKAIVGAVETLLRGTTQFGPGDTTMGGLVYWSDVTDLVWHQAQKDSGASAQCVFKVTYFRRLTS